MVKPPKTMEPSAIKDMSKAGRDRQKAFGDDSFHVYMARKIDMQRSQFGCRQLPPSPVSPMTSPNVNERSQLQEQTNARQSPMLQQPQSVVGNDANLGQQVTLEDSNADSSKQKKFGVDVVLKRLQRRHGAMDSNSSSIIATTKNSKKRHRYEAPATNNIGTMHSSKTSNHGDDDCSIDRNCCDDTSNSVRPFEMTSSIRVRDHESYETFSSKKHVCKVSSVDDTIDKQRNPDKKRTKTGRPDLFFYGIVVLINGYTNPDAETLQRLLQKHGGDVEKYETSRITHIIAEQLSKAKANVYRKQQRNPKPVCQPKWITDSVQAFQLLPFQNYILDDVKIEKKVRSVASIFHQQNTTTIGINNTLEKGIDSTNMQTNSSTNTLCKINDSNSKISNVTAEKDSGVAKVSALSKTTMSPSSKIRDWHDDKHLHEISQARALPHSQVLLKENLAALEIRPKLDASMESTNEERYIHGKVRTVGTDPNFLESFFASSRLSFIGSFRQRARQQQQSPLTKRNISDANSAKMERFVIHVDMDCFFASVVLRNYPQYRDQPVAISHNNDTSDHGSRQLFKDSTSECATCNYVARTYGIKKGMFLSRAKVLCPNLIVLPYDYEGYEEVSDIVSDILDCHASEFNGYVEHVSCDEAYMEIFVRLDASKAPHAIVAEVAEAIREEIVSMTQCTASVGVATNKFLAKVATDHVKPNRSFVMDDFRAILKSLKLRDLCGIGYKMGQKLENENLVSVQDVWDLDNRAESELCKILGTGLGKKVYGYCYGRDDRGIQASERKTIGAECNYGVRFDGPYGVNHMIEGLCNEVEKRMSNVGVKGMKVTLKVKQRKSGAPPPPKYLGHGSCHNLSKSVEVRSKEATRNWKSFFEAAVDMYRELKVDKDDVRGMGIVISKLVDDNSDAVQAANASFPISKWFSKHPCIKSSAKLARKVDFVLPTPILDEVLLEEINDDSNSPDIACIESASNMSLEQNTSCNDIMLPALSQIHMSQVHALPSPMRRQVISEIENLKSKSTSETHNLPNPTREARYRQTDVKRVLRLASVKAGTGALYSETGQGISLTQLELLPLALQLDIANEGPNVYGLTSPMKMSRKGYDLRRTNCSDDTNATELRIQRFNNEHGEEHDAMFQDIGTNHVPPNFFLDNVMPLIAYMNENPDANMVAVNHISEFLCICVAEKRLSDTVALLQNVKVYGNDRWCNDGFESVFQIVDRHVYQHYRANLDIEWILQL